MDEPTSRRPGAMLSGVVVGRSGDDWGQITDTGSRFRLSPSQARRLLLLLFVANLLNYYDRAAPGIVVEPLKLEFSLTDASIGLLSGAFTVVHALLGLPFGRLADRFSRTKVMAWGIGAWSVLTAATGAAPNFALLLAARLGVGVGEASYAPAANSTIADLYPPAKRARAVAVMQLGLPLGIMLAFFTVGSLTVAFGTWRAAFVIAAVPGLILAVCFALSPEPARGATERVRLARPAEQDPASRAFRRILTVPTIWWLIVAGVGANAASTSVNAFSVSLFQRWFGQPLGSAAALAGLVIGLTGLLGLIAGGVAGDLAGRHSSRRRVLIGAAALTLAAPLTAIALNLGPDATALFAVVFGLGWLLQYAFFTTVFPLLSEVVEPALRSTAVAIFLAALYLFGGSLGPILTGALSDAFTASAAGSATVGSGAGLRQALLVVVPCGLLLGAVGLYGASRSVRKDTTAMLTRLGAISSSRHACSDCAPARSSPTQPGRRSS